MRDAEKRKRGELSKYCRKGLHEMTPENTVLSHRGYRLCRTCIEIRKMRVKRGTFVAQRRVAMRSEERQGKAVDAASHLIDPPPLPPFGSGGRQASTFDWNSEIGFMTAYWDDPYAQIKDDSEEIVELAKKGRLGARWIGRERSVELEILVRRIEMAIDRAAGTKQAQRLAMQIRAEAARERRWQESVPVQEPKPKPVRKPKNTKKIRDLDFFFAIDHRTSAVVVIHVPTGMDVHYDFHSSWRLNKEEALVLLHHRLRKLGYE